MTPKEREVLNEIKKCPSISQDELAKILNISRSTIASHIKNLSNKGYILGRQYIVRASSYITVIGAANMDLIGFPEKNFIERDSNLGMIYETSGGVGRNICENLARLGLKTSFISVFGKDDRGKTLIDELEKLEIDTEASFKLDGESTSVYMAILDQDRDMYVAINQMRILEKLSPDLLKIRKDFIESSTLTVLDTNISQESIDYLLSSLKQKFYIDAVSVEKCKKIQKHLSKIEFLKTNMYEAEALSGVKIKDLETSKKAGEKLIEKGLNSVCITLGEHGVLYLDRDRSLYKDSEKIHVLNASGAGDAFMAAFIYATLKDYDIDKKLDFANAASRLTLKSEKTITDKMKVENIEEEINNVKR